MSEKRQWGLHVLVLSSLAIASPLFEVVGRGPEFFVNRRADPVEIFFVSAILIFAIPAILTFIRLLLSLLSQKVAVSYERFAIAALFFLYFMGIGLKALDLNGLQVVTLVLLATGIATYAYHRFYLPRVFITMLAIMVPILLISFFVKPGLRSLVFHSHSAEKLGLVSNKSRMPVVLVVFDEFPLSVLLDRDQKIDQLRFPNFANLAAESYWFKNATAVNQFTPIAMPALLTGLLPKNIHLTPTLNDCPRNIFTMLGASHNMVVSEPFTQLCPDELCRPSAKTSRAQRLKLMLLDLSAVYLNLVLPKDLGWDIPDVTGKWGDFWNDVNLPWQAPKFSQDSRYGDFLKYIRSIKEPEKPTLYFSHQILPHMPFQFMPSGRMYFSGRPIGYENNRWVNDPKSIERGYHQFLLQVAATDNLLGKLINKLKSIGVYDEALVIITADHGLSFQPETYRRGDPDNLNFYEDMLSIPMFVKKPGQKKGVEEWRNVETIDVLPTIADVLQIPLDWKIDGTSMFSTSDPRKQKKAFAGRNPKTFNNTTNPDEVSENEGQELVYALLDSLPVKTLNWKLALPGYSNPSGIDPYYIGERSNLLSKSISEFSLQRTQDLSFKLTMKKGVAKDGKSLIFDQKGQDCPCGIRGKVKGKLSPGQEFAVSINGKIWGFNRLFSTNGKGNPDSFAFFVPENAFKSELNAIGLYLVSNNKGPEISLIALPQEPQE
ncbi:MAG: sulfatase-like hydrolase/transferase [SAR324 cluster bacterium]|uniref:Sulfatase-like hydrolase/transferase n=1 Tax=SAR324 cluster bacterium TaxID=2024889 RepID=A0A7X9FU11_9DELT|nr:sulfatase-like hydrolase/transferase [SAR324 cluster bacterium]